MNAVSKILFILIALLLFNFSAHAENEPEADLLTEDMEESSSVTNTATEETETDVADEVDEQVKTKPQKFKVPSLKQVGMELKERQSSLPNKNLLYCLKRVGLDDKNEIEAFYGRFRAIDKSVNTNGKSASAKRFSTESKQSSFKKKHGKIKVDKGEHFVIIYPEFISVGKKKSSPKKQTDETIGISDIISKSDEAFNETAKLVMIDKFINWSGKVQGKIYIVTEENLWRLIRSGSAKARPDQMVVTKDGYREFYLYVNPDTFDSAPEAAAYAVSQLVLKEYSRAVSRKSESKMPLFYLTGAAFNISGLDSAILENGPKQLDKWGGREISTKSIRELRKRGGELKQLPLLKNNLIKFERIVGSSEYPKNGEDVYYYARQSAALVKYIQENGQLPFLIMTKMLAKGDSFKDGFDDGYVDVRDKLEGKERRPKGKKKKEKRSKKSKKDLKEEKEKEEDAKDTLGGYKELKDQAKDVIFFPLTKEYLEDESADKKKEAKSKKRRRKK